MMIVIDWDLCLGSGMCAGIAPDLFELDSEGNMSVRIETPLEDRRTSLETAVTCCPVEAISVTEAS